MLESQRSNSLRRRCGSFEISTRCIFEDLSIYAVSGAAVYANSSTGLWRNVLIYEMENATIDNGSHVIVEGGHFADHFVADNICLIVSGGSTAVFTGGTRFRHELSVTGANTIALVQDSLVDDPIRIGSGATVRASGNKFSGVTDGTWWINAGTAYDLGGNSYLNAGASPVQTAAPYGLTVATAFTLFPTCNAGNEGQRNMATDSNTTTWAATIAGGSTNRVLGYGNGTNWTVAAR